MKKLNKKKMIAVCGGMLVTAGAYLTYLQAQPQEQMSDLTLANIEAMSEVEDIWFKWRCRGEGTFLCPDQSTAGKVKIKEVH